MGEVERCSPTRVLFTQEELSNFDKEQLLQHWSKQENYINWMESQLSSAQIGIFRKTRKGFIVLGMLIFFLLDLQH